jgi:ketosteroid isomerase-like protein
MRRILLAILLTVSLVGFVKPQVASGDTTEDVKKEIMKIEEEKVSALGKGSSAIADWFERYNADDIAHTDPQSGVRTKAQIIADFKSRKQTVVPGKFSDYRVRVHGNGSTAILTYRNHDTITIGDKTYAKEHFVTDVYVKEDGVWQRVVHHASVVPTK